jgi:Carboxypeptidase activation peptide
LYKSFGKRTYCKLLHSRRIMRLLLSLCLTALLATAFAARKSYSGYVFLLFPVEYFLYAIEFHSYKVIQTRPLGDKDVGKLSHLMHRPEFSFWSQPRVGRPADIMTDPEHTLVLARILRHLSLNPVTIIEDVGE